ncbi:MAG: hydrogenase maturation nickel metallochaperone HypA [Caldilineaceae bacterium]|nr:hydrogenase maturation nickel metallochaperone HypA [Caldilineaceae bacterium]
MHELSMAENIVEIVSDIADRAGATRVEVVRLRIGALAGVVEDALRFGFELAAAGTPLADARLDITCVPVTIYCPHCRQARTPVDAYQLRCAHCGTPSAEVVHGQELEIASIDIADDATEKIADPMSA